MSEPQIYIGCGCVVDDGAGRYLLVRETKAIARGRLALPAGKLEADETIEEAAWREVAEETGFVVETSGLLGIFHCSLTSENSYGVNFVFAARVVSSELTLSAEHPELLWCTHDEVVATTARGEVRGAYVAEAIRRHEAREYLPGALVTVVGRND
ncbi:MAG: ADP-ribose pyrophosphatase YjhB (NUDIX family) [Acidimicrobiales bacterium]|jgi:ADP-ribose pyrophosphatase YjhB (NUDIX family)